jgi:hypothetical protein
MFELNNGTIPCWTTEGIKLLKLDGDKLELTENFVFKINFWIFLTQELNENIIFTNARRELAICDKDFNLIQKLKESKEIQSLCKISILSFADGLGWYNKNLFEKF